MASIPQMKIPRFAAQADSDGNRTLIGVGRILSAWESVEFRFSQLYSSFVGLPNGEAIAQYGSEKIYRLRLDILKRAANNHFKAHCNQQYEARFDKLCEDGNELSQFRNDVAHAIVMDVSSITLFKLLMNLPSSSPAFLLLPPLYLGGRHNDVGAPTFAFSSFELNSGVILMLDFCEEIETFRLECPSLAKPK